MKLIVIRIENQIVTCQLEDGTIIDIAKRWFDDSIKVNAVIEFDINNRQKS